jgi:hypothetical protein
MNSVTREPRVNGPGFFPKIRIDPGKRLHELKKHIFFSVKSETRFLEENVSEIYCETRKTNYEVYVTNENFEACLAFGTSAKNAPGKYSKGISFFKLTYIRVYVHRQYNQIRIQHTKRLYCTLKAYIHKHIHMYEYMLLNFLKRRSRIFKI